MNCWKCKHLVSDVPVKIGFRAVCSHCGIDLHVCVNCRYYAPSKPNDCIVPGTEFVRDREASNLCEEFKVKIELASPEHLQEKKKFNSLFKDDEL